MLEINEKKAFLDACAAAFAWVSYADDELSHEEVDRFIELLNESPYVDEISNLDFEEAYLGLLDVFNNNYEDGVARAEARLEVFIDDLEVASEILKYAEEAVYADKNVDPRELEAVKEIRWTLGLLPSDC